MKDTITKRSLYSWVFYNNTKWQVILIAASLVMVGARVFPLEMQRRIVDEAIGMQLLDKLVLYCLLYLGSVVLASGLKFGINALQAYIGQKTLIHIRKQLFEHIISLPLPFFRRTQPGLVISTLISELAAVAEFIGSAIVMPVVSLMMLLSFASYMFWLDPLMAAVSLAIYPIQIILLPQLQKRQNNANRRRIDTTREVSGMVGETISGVQEVHGNSSYRLEVNKLEEVLKVLFKHNLVMQIYRYGIKVTNNLFQNIGPFLLFLVGGYLVIQGKFSLGALVAFLSAYERVAEPWREMMDFYQLYQDASVRYKQIMSYFDLEPEHPLLPEGREPYEFKGAIELKNVDFTVPGNIKLLDGINLSIKPGEQVALVGFSGSGKSTLAMVIGQLYDYTSGSVKIDGREVSGLSKQDMVVNLATVAQHPFIFNGTVWENLHYSCRALAQQDKDEAAETEMPDLDHTIETVQTVGLFQDVLGFGLKRVIEEGQHEDLVKTLIRMRGEFQSRFGADLADDLEFLNADKFHHYSSVAENITFGDPVDGQYSYGSLAGHEDFVQFLKQANLYQPLSNLGGRIAKETVDILGGLDKKPELFTESPIDIDDFDKYPPIVNRLERIEMDTTQLEEGQKDLLLKLALGFTPGQHKMVQVSTFLLKGVVDARQEFKDKFVAKHPGSFNLYDLKKYIRSKSILENVVFGRIKPDSAGAAERVQESIIQLLIEENLLEDVVAMGLEFQVGSSGDRLSGGQRQKIALARSFLRGAPIMIMDEATAALDNASQARVQRVMERRFAGRTTLIAVVHRLDIIKNYDKVVVLKAGKIIESGKYHELLEKKGALYELVHGKRS
jgi:ABC-type multidrug transport system fused ATPase/permease subunit